MNRLKTILFISLAIVGSFLLAACSPSSGDAMTDDKGMMEKPIEAMEGKTPETMVKGDSTMMEKDDVMMEKDASYEAFTQAAYDAATAEGKTTVLFFYANWCPLCKAEDAVFEEVALDAPENVAVFRVNYRDSDTEPAEEALARTHGVSSQHTKVVVRDGTVLLKTPASWNAETASEQLAALA